MSDKPRIPKDVARKLGFYVYLYINPLDGRVFYVGKGKGSRALVHLQDERRSDRTAIFTQIRKAGRQPLIEILAHNLPTAEAALRVEAAAIDLLGLPSLANQVRGWKSIQLGRVSLQELVALYRRRPIKIKEAAILIRINRLYQPNMSASELYEATRGRWRLGLKRKAARYAFPVFEGVVREVYEILEWYPAGSTFSTRDPEEDVAPDRWEFIGRLAPDRLRRRYIDGHVGRLFPKGAQFPVTYVNI